MKPTSKPVSVLALLVEQDDRAQFINASDELACRLWLAHNYQEAKVILQERSVDFIVSEYRIDDRHSWRDLLEDKSIAIPPPLVIVVDRNADEGMWIEVLTEGAVDLLSKPLNRAEVSRVLNVACRRLREQMMMPASRTTSEEDSAHNKRAAAA